jgi:catechol 2,3-dioxygenase-like lactoylglutathione lyase family enzyme
MKRVPIGSERTRPFLPAKDFELSKRFYEALGFEKVLDDEVAIFHVASGGFVLQRHYQEVAIFHVASGGFVLQRHYQKDWAANSMMQLMVDDLDAWWEHIRRLDLPARFGVKPPAAPALQPWGLRIAYVVDPSGVLWHVAQRRVGVSHDL